MFGRIPGKKLWLVGLMMVLCGAPGALPAQEGSAAPTPPLPQSAPAPSPPDTAQQVLSPAAESPGDLYKDAMHPLDMVRMSLDNWSDAELGALAVGMKKAGTDCSKANPPDYSGDDLYDLARLCTFGQDWNDANTAAQRYIASRVERHRAQAYALSVNALVHMNAIDLAVQTGREMLGRLPYDAEVAYAMRGLEDSLEQSFNPAALALASQEHPLIVTALQSGRPLKAAQGTAQMGVGALYEAAMRLAFLEQYGGDKKTAAATAAEVASALPASAVLVAEDRQRVDAVNARYQLLGAPLPAIKLLRPLQSPLVKARLDPNLGAATVLVLFPDWCVACRRMMKTLTEFAAANRDTPIQAYGLVFADDSVVSGQEAHEQNFKDMRGTQTFVVPQITAQSFGAVDFPLALVVDHTGIVRFIDPIAGDAFNGDSYIGKVIVRMVKAEGEGLKRIAKTN